MKHFVHLGIALLMLLSLNNTLFSQQSAYVVQNIPGTIEIENFDNGGEGVAYHDNESTQKGTDDYRAGVGVDIFETSDGGYKTGWNINTEWLEYTIANITAGTYTITYRAASPKNTPGSIILKLGDGPDGTNFTQIAEITINKTGGWDSFSDFSVSGINLEAGTNKVLRIDFSGINEGFDMNYVKFTRSQGPFAEHVIPGKIECEDFDYGGEGFAYHEVDDDNKHPDGLRETDLDEGVDYKLVGDGSDNMKIYWTADGEWLEYTIASITEGPYKINLSIASGAASPGDVEILLGDGPDGTNFETIATIPIGNTGGWTPLGTFTSSSFYLQAGTNKVLRVVSAGDADLDYVEIVNVNATGVTVDPTSLSLDIGQSEDLTETIIPPDAFNKSVTWSSSDNNIATVDANGLVTGIGPGSATITVTTDDGGHTAQAAVEVSCTGIPLPTGLNAQKGVGEITLFWNTVEGADGYIIKYGVDEGGPYPNSVEIEDGQTDFTIIDGLDNGTTYYFVIATKIGICVSDNSGIVSAQPSASITEYTNHNVYVSTSETTGKNLGAGFKGIRIFGHPNLQKGFNGYTKPVNFLIDIAAPNIETDPNACLTISFDDENLPEGLNLATLDLYRFDEGTNTWTKMDGTYNAEEKSVSLCDIDEFSQWTLAGSAPESVPLKNWGIFLIIFVIAGGVVLRIFR